MSRPDVTLRIAVPADIGAITEIYADAVMNGTASYELNAPSAEEVTARMQALTTRSYPYIVAEENGSVVGYAYAGPFRPRRAYRFCVEDSVYLAPAAQGRGIGRVLLGSLIEQSEALGFRQMIAVIGDGHNHRASIRLHEALGFRHAGALEGSGYKFGRWLDTVFMQRALTAGAATPPDPESLPERLFREGR